MKPRIRTTSNFRNRYPSYRMSVAIERLLAASTPEEKSRATKWAAAWSLVEVSPHAWRQTTVHRQMRDIISKAADSGSK